MSHAATVARKFKVHEMAPSKNGLASRKGRAVAVLVSTLRELHFRNIRRIFQLIALDPTGKALLSSLVSARNTLLSQPKQWEPALYVEEAGFINVKLPGSSAFTAHIFYEEFIEGVKKIALETDCFDTFLITSPKAAIVDDLDAFFSSNNLSHEVRLTPNRGRNFGPLLVEFGAKLLEYDFVTHVHSKKSPHVARRAANSWATKCWELLAQNHDQVERLHAIIASDSRIGIAYPLVLENIPSSSYNWGLNTRLADEYFGSTELTSKHPHFPFPAGGMFISRTSAISEILKMPHTYEDFPEEKGQLDGTWQHTLERLFGVIPLEAGYWHLMFDSRTNLFTLDTDYSHPQQ